MANIIEIPPDALEDEEYLPSIDLALQEHLRNEKKFGATITRRSDES